MTLYYQIKLLSDWHVGSGLDAGPNVDLQVLKDATQLPYIPGKTIKGLLRDALQDINELPHSNFTSEVNQLFGLPTGSDSCRCGKLVFSNAVLPVVEREEIIAHHLIGFLYRTISSTSINRKSGIAESGTLRTIEVCRPLVLEGQIEGEVNDAAQEILLMAFKWLRHLGLQRNRGLGRCHFTKKNNTPL